MREHLLLLLLLLLYCTLNIGVEPSKLEAPHTPKGERRNGPYVRTRVRYSYEYLVPKIEIPGFKARTHNAFSVIGLLTQRFLTFDESSRPKHTTR